VAELTLAAVWYGHRRLDSAAQPHSTNALFLTQIRVTDSDPSSRATGSFDWINTAAPGTPRQRQIEVRFRF
jgi:hypothetical protein